MPADLNEQEATEYDQAPVAHGEFIGAAESFKSPGNGPADAVWVWDWLGPRSEASMSRTPRHAQHGTRRANSGPHTRNFGGKCGALVVVAGEVKMAAQRLDAVFEADQPGSATRIGGPHPVVCH